MAFSAAEQPHPFRLVGTTRDADADRMHDAEEAIARENRRAAANPDLLPTDPRWVLAVRAYAQLQGSTLTPERRRNLLRSAQQLGVRPFDANVIIAIVQDQARSGGNLHSATPTLALLSPPDSKRAAAASTVTRWLTAVVLAAAANAILIWWLLSGV